MDNRKRLIEKIIEDIYELRKRISSQMHVFFTEVQLTHTQAIVLKLIKKRGIINIKELASFLGTSSSAATQLVNGLVNKELLMRKRNPHDRRTLKIELTDKAHRQFDVLKNRSSETLTSIFNILDDAELQKYFEINYKLLENMQAADNKDKMDGSVRADV